MKVFKYTQETYLKKCFDIHGNLYDYSLVEYVGSNKKIKIICKTHGIFEQLAFCHIQGQNCAKCQFYKKRKGLDIFLKKAKEIHNDEYDYSLVNFINRKQKIEIVCKKHGIFTQRVNDHLCGRGCPDCNFRKYYYTFDVFLKNAIKKHSNKYSYYIPNNKLDLIDQDDITIMCPNHGKFNQKIYYHLKGSGCPDCRLSIGETNIHTFLKNNNINYISEYKFNDCLGINNGKLSFDFFIEEYDVCIEYDGIQHFEPIDFFGGIDAYNYRKQNDKIKDEYCILHNINLIRIAYTENIENKLNELLISKYCVSL